MSDIIYRKSRLWHLFYVGDGVSGFRRWGWNFRVDGRGFYARRYR